MSIFMKRSQVRDILVLMLAASLIIGNGTVFAEKEKPGKVLVLEKKDGQTIRGELLDVKFGTLSMLVYKDNRKIDFRLDEIAKIKSEFGRGMLNGYLIGAGVGLSVWGPLKLSDAINREDSGSLILVFLIPILVGLVVGTLVDFGTKTSIQLEEQSQGKLLKSERKLKPLARYRMNSYSYWQFVFSGPSDETHVVIFTLTGDPGKFEFHGVNDHNGTFTDDGKVVVMALPGRPDTVCSGRFIDTDHMAGTWESSGQTWTWTAVRTSWTAAVKETPICESKLF